MKPVDTLKSILNNKCISEDGDVRNVELKPGLSEDQLNVLRRKLPNNYLPEEIEELLKFTSGFKFFGVDEVTFDSLGLFGFEAMFPISIQLAGDGFGNYWILDIDKNGNWGNVFFVCYDPSVIVKHSIDISEFITLVGDFGKPGNKSHHDIIHEQIIMEIWTKFDGLIELEIAKKSEDRIIKEFANLLPPNFLIADLRTTSNNAGFCWGKKGLNSRIIRHETELLWGIEASEKKRFFSKLFNGKG